MKPVAVATAVSPPPSFRFPPEKPIVFANPFAVLQQKTTTRTHLPLVIHQKTKRSTQHKPSTQKDLSKITVLRKTKRSPQRTTQQTTRKDVSLTPVSKQKTKGSPQQKTTTTTRKDVSLTPVLQQKTKISAQQKTEGSQQAPSTSVQKASPEPHVLQQKSKTGAQNDLSQTNIFQQKTNPKGASYQQTNTSAQKDLSLTTVTQQATKEITQKDALRLVLQEHSTQTQTTQQKTPTTARRDLSLLTTVQKEKESNLRKEQVTKTKTNMHQHQTNAVTNTAENTTRVLGNEQRTRDVLTGLTLLPPHYLTNHTYHESHQHVQHNREHERDNHQRHEGLLHQRGHRQRQHQEVSVQHQNRSQQQHERDHQHQQHEGSLHYHDRRQHQHREVSVHQEVHRSQQHQEQAHTDESVHQEVQRPQQHQEQAHLKQRQEGSTTTKAVHFGGTFRAGKVSNLELDALFTAPSFLEGKVGKSIVLQRLTPGEATAMRTCGRHAAPVYLCNHWVAFFFYFDKVKIEVFDSGPSPHVHAIILRECARLWPDVKVSFERAPRQRRFSDDCGVYTAMAIIANLLRVPLTDRSYCAHNIVKMRTLLHAVCSGAEERSSIIPLLRSFNEVQGGSTGTPQGGFSHAPDQVASSRGTQALVKAIEILLNAHMRLPRMVKSTPLEAGVIRAFAKPQQQPGDEGHVHVEVCVVMWSHTLSSKCQTWMGARKRGDTEWRFFARVEGNLIIPLRDNTETITWVDMTLPQRDITYWGIRSVPSITFASTQFQRTELESTQAEQNQDSESDSDSDSERDEEEATEELFRRGHHATTLPVVVHMTGSTLSSTCQLEDRQLPDSLSKALTTSTRTTHARVLRWIAELPEVFHTERAAVAVLENLHRLRKLNNWTWSTMLKNTASTGSALRLLPIYKTTCHSLILTHDVVWTQGLEHIRKYVRTEMPRTPVAMTQELFNMTLTVEPTLKNKVALLLMWATAGRVGDILQLAHEDIKLEPEGSLTITYSRGKAVLLRGPYTVSTAILEPTFIQLFKQLWDPSRKSEPLFDLAAPAMLTTFRRVDKRLEAKSVRRGALQHLALNGIPMETLMQFSGHYREKTLLRYLGWGRTAKAQHRSMITAGQLLFQQHSSQH